MVLWMNSRDLVCLEYADKHGRLHQRLNYIVYIWYCIDFDCIIVALQA